MSPTTLTFCAGILVGLSYAQSCGNSNSPVVIMCFNNDITIDSIGHATSEGVAPGARDCHCVVSTEDVVVKVNVEMTSRVTPNCEFNTVTLQAAGQFSTTLHCGQKQTSSLNINGTIGLSQLFQKRTNDPVCLKYTVSSGKDKVKLKCTGDDLPSTTTTTTTTTKRTTSKITQPKKSPTASTAVVSSPSTDSTSQTTRRVQTTVTKAPAKETTTLLDKTTSTSHLTSTNNYGASSTDKTTTTGSTEEIQSTGQKTETQPATTVPTKTTTIKDTTSYNKNLGGIIAGSVIGSIAFAVLLALLVVYIHRRRHRQSQKRQLQHKRLSQNGAIENPTFVESGQSQKGAPNGTINLQSGHPDTRPVQESGDDVDISVLYATVNKKNLDKADTLF